MEYLKARFKERDTKVVIGAAVYSIARAFIPPQYAIFVDGLASLLGLGVAATPLK